MHSQEEVDSDTTSPTPRLGASPPGGAVVFDLASEASDLVVAGAPERTVRTLARLDTLRLTLMRMKAGSAVLEHKADHQVSVHTLSGHVAVHTGDDRLDLPLGYVAVLGRAVMRDIVATEDSVILITVCPSQDQHDGARRQ